MKYNDGTCTWDHLRRADAFTIERHSLRVAQPMEYANGRYRLNCLVQGRGRLFARIDFSKGFLRWWFLNHMEIKLPSEHTQNGKRYDAEVQLAHFYSVDAVSNAGVANQMGTVSIFLQAYENVGPYAYLDKLICQWREVEERERLQCGLHSVAPYPGCFNYNRGNPITSIARSDTNGTRIGSRGNDGNLRRMVLDDKNKSPLHLDIDPQNFRGDDWFLIGRN